MKLNLRAKALGKKITLISTAFVLAVSTLTASVPFVLSERASAVGGMLTVTPATCESPVNAATYTGSRDAADKIRIVIDQLNGVRIKAEDIPEQTSFDLVAALAAYGITAPYGAFTGKIVKNISHNNDEFITNIAGTLVNPASLDCVNPAITVNGQSAAHATFGAGVVRIQVADDNYDRTVIKKKNDQGVFVDRFTYKSSQGPSFKVDWLGEGEYTAQAFDTQENGSVIVGFTIDKTAPTINSIVANGRAVALDGSTKLNASEGILYQVNVSDPAGFGYTYVEMNKNLNWQAASTGAATTTLDTPASKYTDGQQYGLKICTYDKVNNHACTQVNFMIDNSVPSMTLRIGENGQVIAAGSVVDKTGKNIRIEKEKSSKIYVTRPNGTTWSGGVQPPSYTGGKPSLDWLFTADGLYTFYVEDEAGNTSDSYGITIDTSGPSIEDVALASVYSNGDRVVVNGTVSDDNLDYYRCNVYDAANRVGLNGSLNNYTRYYSEVNNGQLCDIDISALPGNATYTVRVVAYDKAGHVNVNGYTGYSFAVDSDDPSLSITSPLTNTEQPRNFTVTGEVSDAMSGVQNVNYEVMPLEGGYGSATSGGAVVSGAANLANGTWSFSTGVTSGFYRVVVTATDQVGNTKSESIDIYVDASGPDIEFGVTANGRTIAGTTSDPERPVTITVGSYSTVSVTPLASGSWTYTLPAATPAGTYTVVVQSTDIYGNVSNIPEQLTFLEVPIIPVESGDEDTPSGATSGDDTDNSQQTNGGFPLTTFGVAQQVLGTDTTIPQSEAENNDGTAEVAGSATENLAQAVDADNTDGTAMGLAWYWWLLIIAAVATIIWGIVAAIRGRQSA